MSKIYHDIIVNQFHCNWLKNMTKYTENKRDILCVLLCILEVQSLKLPILPNDIWDVIVFYIFEVVIKDNSQAKLKPTYLYWMTKWLTDPLQQLYNPIILRDKLLTLPKDKYNQFQHALIICNPISEKLLINNPTTTFNGLIGMPYKSMEHVIDIPRGKFNLLLGISIKDTSNIKYAVLNINKSQSFEYILERKYSNIPSSNK